jgi:hypothetical protein
VCELLPDLGDAVARCAAPIGVTRVRPRAEDVARAAATRRLELGVMSWQCLKRRTLHTSQVCPSATACRVSGGDHVSHQLLMAKCDREGDNNLHALGLVRWTVQVRLVEVLPVSSSVDVPGAAAPTRESW